MESETIHILMYSVLVITAMIIVFIFIKNFKDIKLILEDIMKFFTRLKVKIKEQEDIENKITEKTSIDLKIEKAEETMKKIDTIVEDKVLQLEKKIESSQEITIIRKEDIPPDIIVLKPEVIETQPEPIKECTSTEIPGVLLETKERANPLWLALPVVIIGVLGWFLLKSKKD